MTRSPDKGQHDAPILNCMKVSKQFGGLRAVDGVDVEVGEGEIVGLVGPNGSGKSTLINLISGQLKPTSGNILARGRNIAELPRHFITTLGIARTYQIPQPFENLTVIENVAISCMFGSQSLGRREAVKAAEDYVDFCGLGDAAHSYPSDINLHQRKFLELARSLATRPSLLCLDEVLAGLNPVEVEQSIEMINKIHHQGIALLIVEHLVRVITALSHRIIVMNEGRVISEGDPETVMSDPVVVTAYLG